MYLIAFKILIAFKLLLNLRANPITQMNLLILTFPPAHSMSNWESCYPSVYGIKLLSNLLNGIKVSQNFPNGVKALEGGCCSPKALLNPSMLILLCYHNQTDNVCAGHDWIFQYYTKTKIEHNQIFSKSLLCYRDKATIKTHKNPQGWQKAGILLPRGGICHPMATGLK